MVSRTKTARKGFVSGHPAKWSHMRDSHVMVKWCGTKCPLCVAVAMLMPGEDQLFPIAPEGCYAGVEGGML